MNDTDDRGRVLRHSPTPAASRQPFPGGHALVRPTTGIADRVIGAQPVAVYRDEAKIFQKLSALGAFAGDDWFYRFPVRKREGGQDWIEGPSIKLANDVARIFGNNVNEVREIDVGDAWIFYARFTDIETGFSMERAYRQRKSQASMRTKDADRQLDIAYQIGQSKAIRNCIVNSLQMYADHAFKAAQNSLVDKLARYQRRRDRIFERLKEINVPVNRAERAIGRASQDGLLRISLSLSRCGKASSTTWPALMKCFRRLGSGDGSGRQHERTRACGGRRAGEARKPEYPEEEATSCRCRSDNGRI